MAIDDLDPTGVIPEAGTAAPRKTNFFDQFDAPTSPAVPDVLGTPPAAPSAAPTVDTADIMGGAERRLRLVDQMAADGSLDALAARLRKQRMLEQPMSAAPSETETKARAVEWDGVLEDLNAAAKVAPELGHDIEEARKAKAAEALPADPRRLMSTPFAGVPADKLESVLSEESKWLKSHLSQDWGHLTPEEQAQWVEETRTAAATDLEAADKRLADLEAMTYTLPDGRKGLRAPRGTGASYETTRAALLKERDKALGKQALIDAIDAGKADPATKTWLRSSVENVGRGFGADLLAGMIEAAGIARGYAVRNTIDPSFDPASDALYQVGRHIRTLAETAYPGDPARERDLSQQVARGIGQMAGIYGSSAVAAILRLGPVGMAAAATLTGSALETSQQFEAATRKMADWDAKIRAAQEEGASPEVIARMRANPPVTERDRALASILGIIVGASEALPLATNWTRALGPAFETGIGGMFAKGVEQAVEEGIQEFGQTYGSDAIAKWLYDPERVVGESAGESAAVGAILGFGFSSAGAALTPGTFKKPATKSEAAAKPADAALPAELTAPEPIQIVPPPAEIDDQDVELAAEETGLPPEKVRQALPFAAMITDDGGGPDAVARARQAAATEEDPDVLTALEALTPRAVRKAKATAATPAPAAETPAPRAETTPSLDFDPYATSLLGTLLREGREPLVAKLEQIGDAAQLREMASAQQVALPAELWSSDDVPALATAIADGVQVRANERMAAAESSKRVEVPKVERVTRKSTLGKGLAEVAAETEASGARATAEKAMAEPGMGFSPAAVLMRDGEEALSDRLDEMSLAEIKRLVKAQRIGEVPAKAKRGALVKMVMDHARARVTDRMAAADGTEGPAAGQPSPVAAETTPAAPESRATAEAAPEAPETAYVITPDGGMEVEVRPEIVDLGALTAASGDLQPRDRSRAESDIGIRDRAARLDPEQLMPGRVSDAGAPIVDQSGVVLSGNGRIASIRAAYEAFPERATAYRKAIGAGPEMAMPVLVQRLVSPMPRADMVRFADLSNRARIAGMSATERAIRDARSAGPEVMGLYQGGDFQAGPNREFYRLFMDAVVTAAERGSISRDGVLTKEGQDRMAAAVLAAAYGDPAALAQMLESTDDNIRALSNAMREAAGAFVRLKAGIAAGVVKPELDITPQIAEAAKLISRLRDQGVKPDSYFAQLDVFSQPDPIVEQIVRLIYNESLSRAVSQKAMTDAFLFYATEAIKHQVGGFIADDTTARDIIRLAKERQTNAAQNDLFAPRAEPVPPSREQGAGGERAAVSEPVTGPGPDLVSRFYDIIAGKLPRAKWAGALGVSESDLAPLIDDAVAAKWLRRRGKDVYRAPAKGRPPRPDAVPVPPVVEALPTREAIAGAPTFETRQTKPRKGPAEYVATFTKAPSRAVSRAATTVAADHGGTHVAKRGKTKEGFKFTTEAARAAFLEEITYGKSEPVPDASGDGVMFAITGTPEEELARATGIVSRLESVVREHPEDADTVGPKIEEARRLEDSLIVYHGSEFKFDTFDPGRIGRENGNTEGWGLYFSEQESGAGGYRANSTMADKTLPHTIAIGGKSLATTKANADEIASLAIADAGATGQEAEAIRELVRTAIAHKEDFEWAGAAAVRAGEMEPVVKNAALAALKRAVVSSERGHLYQATLGVGPEQMASWADPVAKQSPEHLAALRKLAAANGIGLDEAAPFSKLYGDLATKLGGKRAASEAMVKAGIPGVRYVGGPGPQTNYVLYDVGKVEHLSRDGEPLFAIGGTGPDQDALGYYSKALEAAKGLKQAKGTPEQMLAQLKSAGVKDAEIEATGLAKFLAEKTKASDRSLTPDPQGRGVEVPLAETPEYKQAEAAAVKAFDADLQQNRHRYFETDYDENGDSIPLNPDEAPSLYRSNAFAILPATAEAVEAGARSLGFELSLHGSVTSASRYGTIRIGGQTMKVRVADHELQSGLHDRADFNIAPDSMTPFQFFEALIAAKRPKSKPASPPTVTRDEIVSWLTENRVKLQGRVTGRTPGAADPTKWSAYSLDSTNPTYREVVLHLPVTTIDREAFMRDHRAFFPNATDAERQAAFNKFARGETTSGLPEVAFGSGHFPEPNITGHMMVSDVSSEGKSVLLIDQIQSDWGQKLRDGGVKDEAKIAKLKADIEALHVAAEERGAKFRELDDLRLPADQHNARAKTLSDEVKRDNDRLDLLRAELRTAETAVTGNPLVNTTDQWVNTTLRRAIRMAAEDGKDYIAIPKGETVESYNVQGDSAGNAVFYDKIVPKNLKNLLAKLDKDSPAPIEIDTVDSPSGKTGLGKGFTLFPLTRKAKDAALYEGQPLFALNASNDTDRRNREAALTMVRGGVSFEVPSPTRAAAWKALAGHLWMVPDDVPVRILKRVAALTPEQVTAYEAARGQGSAAGMSVAVFEDSNGAEVKRALPLSFARSGRALSFPSTSAGPAFIGFLRFGGTEFGETLGGELRHELVHVLRRLDKFSPLLWGKLLRHAKSLRILDTDLATYLAMIGKPASYATGTILSNYTTLYRGRPDFQEVIDQEYVAHLLELAYHRQLLPMEIDPIRAEIEAFLSGDLSGKAAARPAPKVSLGTGVLAAIGAPRPLTRSGRITTLSDNEVDRLASLIRRAIDERADTADPRVGRDGRAGDVPAGGGSGRSEDREIGAEGIAGAEAGGPGRPAGAEAAGRAPVDLTLRAAGLQLLGDSYTPEAIASRAAAAGFTTRAWHAGFRDIPTVAINRPGADYGFHVAIGTPEAANERVGYGTSLLKKWLGAGDRNPLARVYPLLINPGRSLRMPDIEHWLSAENWSKGTQSREYDGPIELRKWLTALVGSSPTNASASAKMRAELPAMLAEMGYGSVVYKNKFENKGKDSLLLLDAARVRSAVDLFHPEAEGAAGLLPSEPLIERDIRTALNDAAAELGLAEEPLFAIGGNVDEEPSLNDIIAEVKSVLDLGVTQGLWGITIHAGNRTRRLRPPKGMRGQFRTGTDGISVRQSRDIGAIAHEGGHALESRYAALRQLMRDNEPELGAMISDLSAYAEAAPVSEGFAEFFRRYIIDPKEAQRRAPNFYTAFEEFLDSGDVGLLADLKGIQDAYQNYIGLDPLAAMSRDLVGTEEDGLWQKIKSGEVFQTVAGRLDTAYTALIDDLSPVSRMVRKLLEVADQNGIRDADGNAISLPAHDNPAKLFRLFRDSYAQGRMWLSYGVPDHGATTPKGPSLHDALVKAFGGTNKAQWNKKAYHDFGAYLISLRAVAEFDRLAEKAAEIRTGRNRLASLEDGLPLLTRRKADAEAKAGRRERALTRLTALDQSYRREQASLTRKADRLVQEHDLDQSIGPKRIANIKAELRTIEKRLGWLSERILAAEDTRAGLIAERDAARADARAASRLVSTRKADVAATERELVRLHKRGASHPPTLEGRDHHVKVIEQVERDHPHWVEAADMVHQFTHRMLTVRYQAGLISKELYDTLSERKDWYVPFMRDMSDAELGEVFAGQAGDRRKWSPFKKYDGSDRQILNPLSILSQEAYVAARQIAFNDAVRTLDALATRAGPGSAAIVERLEQEIDLGNDPFAKIEAMAIGYGIDPADANMIATRIEQTAADQGISAMMSPEHLGPKPLPVLPVWQDGRRVMLRITDPDLGADVFNAINGLGREFSGLLSDIIAAPARILRLGVTAHPDFMMRNLLRDLFAGFILTGAPPVLTHLRGFWHMGTNSEFARSYAAAGGIMAGEAVASISKSKDRLDISRLRKRGYKVAASVHGLYSIVGSIETAGRLGLASHAYKRAKAYNPALTDYQAMQEAAFVARDVIDYGRRGSKMLAVNRVITFFNAQIQGLDKFARALGGQGDRGSVFRRHLEVLRKHDEAVPMSADEKRLLADSAKLYARLAAVNLFLYALYLLFADDEEYREINGIKKSGMQPVKILGEWAFIPKPFEQALPVNLMEIATDAIAGRDPRWAERMRESLFQTLAPPSVPQAFRLWRDMSTNIDARTGREIVPAHLRDLEPHLRFDAWTSQLSRDVSKAMFDAGVPDALIPAPPMVDYLLTAGGAYWGREMQNDYAVVSRAVKGEDVLAGDWRDFMVIRGLTGDPERMSESTKRFWELMNRSGGDLVRAAATYDELLKTGKPDEAVAYLFSDRLSPDQRIYAIADQHLGSAEKRMHPMTRLEAVIRIASKIGSEAMLDRLDYDGQPVTLTPSQKEEALDVLARIKMVEAANTLRLTGEPGWTTRKGFDVELTLAELGAIDPKLRAIYEERLADKKVAEFKDVADGWPSLRKELLGMTPEDVDTMPRRKGRAAREEEGAPAAPN